MKTKEKTFQHKTIKTKPLPISGSDLCLLAFSFCLCGLWILFPTAVLSSKNTDKTHPAGMSVTLETPVARYVTVEFPDSKKDYVLDQNLSDNDLVNDEFALQTTLPLPAAQPPSVRDLAETMSPSRLPQDSYEAFTQPLPILSDLPEIPEHPYAEVFSYITTPAPSIFVSRALQNAGFIFHQPTNPIPPHFSFTSDISFGKDGKVRVLLVDTQVPPAEFLSWRNALMLSTTTNSASGRISFQ